MTKIVLAFTLHWSENAILDTIITLQLQGNIERYTTKIKGVLITGIKYNLMLTIFH